MARICLAVMPVFAAPPMSKAFLEMSLSIELSEDSSLPCSLIKSYESPPERTSSRFSVNLKRLEVMQLRLLSSLLRIPANTLVEEALLAMPPGMCDRDLSEVGTPYFLLLSLPVATFNMVLLFLRLFANLRCFSTLAFSYYLSRKY